MKQLFIVGAGEFGREILSFSSDIHQKEWEIRGFLDANPKALKGYNSAYQIVGDPERYMPQKGDCFICSIGNIKNKLRLCHLLLEKGAEFINLIHPTAWISRDAQLGVGNIIFPNAYIATKAKMGNFITLNFSASVGHDVIVGEGCMLSAHCDLTGKVELGTGVFMGSHAVVIPGKKVGDFATIGAGSVVMRFVPKGAVVVGVPAKKIN